jgi:hypothetical protein
MMNIVKKHKSTIDPINYRFTYIQISGEVCA